MIRDVFKKFGFSPIGVVDVVSPVEDIDSISELREEIKEERLERISEIQDSFNKIDAARDDLLDMRYDNEVQERDLELLKGKYFNLDQLDTLTISDLADGVVGDQYKRGATMLKNDSLFKRVLKEQADSDAFLEKLVDLEALSPVMAEVARKAWIERYKNKKNRSDSQYGFPLSIDEFQPVDAEGLFTEDLKDHIQREYKMVKDENSPDGFLFINKVSHAPGTIEDFRAIADERIKYLSNSPRFKHNMEALIAFNSEDGNLYDQKVYQDFRDGVINKLSKEKVVDTYLRNAKRGGGSGDSSSPSAGDVEGGYKMRNGEILSDNSAGERKFIDFYKEMVRKYPSFDWANNLNSLRTYQSSFGKNDIIGEFDPKTGEISAGTFSAVIPRLKGKDGEPVKDLSGIYLDGKKIDDNYLKSIADSLPVEPDYSDKYGIDSLEELGTVIGATPKYNRLSANERKAKIVDIDGQKFLETNSVALANELGLVNMDLYKDRKYKLKNDPYWDSKINSYRFPIANNNKIVEKTQRDIISDNRKKVLSEYNLTTNVGPDFKYRYLVGREFRKGDGLMVLNSNDEDPNKIGRPSVTYYQFRGGLADEFFKKHFKEEYELHLSKNGASFDFDPNNEDDKDKYEKFKEAFPKFKEAVLADKNEFIIKMEQFHRERLYNPAKKHLEENIGLKLDDEGMDALVTAISTQYGNYVKLMNNAKKRVKGDLNEKTFIEAITEERLDWAKKFDQQHLNSRIEDERVKWKQLVDKSANKNSGGFDFDAATE